jgi:hypothetical protein
MRFVIRAQHGIHAREMAPALIFEPAQNFAVDAEVYRRLAWSNRRDELGALPKAFVQFDLFCTRTREGKAPGARHGVDLIQGSAPDIVAGLVVPYARQ